VKWLGLFHWQFSAFPISAIPCRFQHVSMSEFQLLPLIFLLSLFRFPAHTRRIMAKGNHQTLSSGYAIEMGAGLWTAVCAKRPAILRRLELEALSALAKNANARNYIGFEKHIAADAAKNEADTN
jgi:hypothetical protein